MKQALYTKYGPPDVLHVVEVPKPTIAPHEILIKVHAAAATSADARIRGARFPRGFGFLARIAFGITRPRNRVLGSTYSGVIAQVGDSVTQHKVGDAVCGMTGVKMGTYSEYITVGSFKALATKPDSVSHEDAAGVLFGGTAALYFVRDILNIGEGQTVLINGASGAVGSNAVQLARHFGATVTAVTSAKNAALVRKLGASEVIDYTTQDIAGMNQTYDAVLDAVGTISPALARTLIASGGRAGLMVAGLGETLRAHGSIKTGTAPEKAEDIAFLLDLVANGTLKVVIDKVYAFEDIVAAHRHVDSGQKVGNVIIRVVK